jgi:putative transposase
MARLPRLTVTDYPHHVILRGNNRQVIFGGEPDMRRMLALLEESSVAQGVDVHAYVLMDNHFHLLLTPRRERGVPLMMQAVGRSYVRSFNLQQGRTGTLWEGRYRSTLIQSERYLLTCMAYIDLNPVRAGMVEAPENYPWSSHAHYIGRLHQRLLTPPALYWELGNTPFAREAAYGELVRAGIAEHHQRALTAATLSGWALGDPGFLAVLESQTPRRIQPGKAGRPFRNPSPIN